MRVPLGGHRPPLLPVMAVAVAALDPQWWQLQVYHRLGGCNRRGHQQQRRVHLEELDNHQDSGWRRWRRHPRQVSHQRQRRVHSEELVNRLDLV